MIPAFLVSWGAGLLGKFGLQIAALGLGVALLAGAYLAGEHAERTRGEAAALRVQIEVAREDAASAAAAQSLAENQEAAMAAAKEKDDEALAQLREAIATRPVAAQCLATQSDADSLRRIK